MASGIIISDRGNLLYITLFTSWLFVFIKVTCDNMKIKEARQELGIAAVQWNLFIMLPRCSTVIGTKHESYDLVSSLSFVNIQNEGQSKRDDLDQTLHKLSQEDKVEIQ